jgi:predicted acetyltransferase
MEDSTVLMTEHRFDVAMLFGIANFYTKFGYATALPEQRMVLQTKDAQEAVQSYRVRKFEMRDAPKVLVLYVANNAERTGTVVRHAERWKGFKMGSSFRERADALVVLDEGNEVIGYFVCDDTQAHCTLAELGFQDRTIFETIVRFLADRANCIGREEIECSLPADHPFAIFCRRYGCRITIRYPKNSGGMMRIINQSSTLEKIVGELGKRLQRSAQFSQWCGNILISTDLGQDCLEIDRGCVERTTTNTSAGYRLEIRQDQLIQLMMGRRSIEDLAVDADVSVDAEIIPVLETLFPIGYPHVWWPDRF